MKKIFWCYNKYVVRETAESDEFQAIRAKAEEDDDEAPIEVYLRDKGLWEKYVETRDFLECYLKNMDDIKYLYVVVIENKDSLYDMYLMDDYDNPLYETGYYEEREPEFIGIIEGAGHIDPTISHGDWGVAVFCVCSRI